MLWPDLLAKKSCAESDYKTEKSMPLQLRDARISSVLALRAWGVLAGGVTILFILNKLSLQEQGYYYTFASLIALQIFFELGLNSIIILIVSRESLTLGKVDVADITRNAARVADLLRWATRYFLVCAVLFFFILLFAGYFFFDSERSAPKPPLWQIAWLILCLASSINLYYSPQIALLEGLNEVKTVARVRLLLSVIGYFACWLYIAITPSLIGMTLVSSVAAIGSMVWIQRHSGLQKLRRIARPTTSTLLDAPEAAIRWSVEVAPLQWRIALSWMSGYLAYQMFTPVIFSGYGALEAGRFGLTLTIFSYVTTISMSWITARMPEIGGLLAEGRTTQSEALFKKLTIESTTVNFLLSTLIVISIISIDHLGIKAISSRISAPETSMLLALASLVNHVVFAMASYMRAHKKEPLLVYSVTMGVLVALGSLLCMNVSVVAVTLNYFMMVTFIGLPWVVHVFRQYWSR